MTDISLDTMFETIGTILDGNYVTEDRMLLEAGIFSGEQSLFNVLAFNDAVVSKGLKGSMIELEVRIDGKYLSPAWSPPAEVKRDKPSLPAVIPGGSPRNPMGAAAMTL